MEDNVNNSLRFSRTELLLGKEAICQLAEARVAIFGVGGVGGYALEALVRSGIGEIDVFDNDTVSESNINRQILATCDTVGKMKAEVARERALSINPTVKVNVHPVFYSPENADEYDLTLYDYIIDAIDTVKSKIELITRADRAGVPIISSMGAGGKLDPTAFKVADIYETSVCPLARVIRREAKLRGIKHLKVVFSKEEPIKLTVSGENDTRHVPGSISFVPSVVGLIMAGEVIRDIAKIRKSE